MKAIQSWKLLIKFITLWLETGAALTLKSCTKIYKLDVCYIHTQSRLSLSLEFSASKRTLREIHFADGILQQTIKQTFNRWLSLPTLCVCVYDAWVCVCANVWMGVSAWVCVTDSLSILFVALLRQFPETTQAKRTRTHRRRKRTTAAKQNKRKIRKNHSAKEKRKTVNFQLKTLEKSRWWPSRWHGRPWLGWWLPCAAEPDGESAADN